YTATPHRLPLPARRAADHSLAINSITYDGSAAAPTNVKVSGYAVVASFNGSSNYNSASASATEIINKATPVVKIFNGATDVTNRTATFTQNASPQRLTSTV